MTTLLAVFLIAFLLSLFLTPLSGKLGKKLGAIDLPTERKIHTTPIPRSGGIAVFLSMALTIAVSVIFNTDITNQLVFDRKTLYLMGGAFLCFSVGFVDDFFRIKPGIKFFFQISSATMAFLGGVKIQYFHLWGIYIDFSVFSYFVTVFWFVLFVNAVNFMDGLDGLASGTVFFASSVLVVLSIIRGEFLSAMFFATLAGALLGFLKYNFNPASVFLGDGGSYFLGFSIAGLSILSSAKSQLGAVILLPVIALGLPLFDTILSPLRRFAKGRSMFKPDSGHIHHKLIHMGFSTKHVVVFIYFITLCLGIMAILMVNLRDERTGLFLILLGAGVIFFIRKLGYFDYFVSDRIYEWFTDISDDAGLSYTRRNLLSIQMKMNRVTTLDELWENLCEALDLLNFDKAELQIEAVYRRYLETSMEKQVWSKTDNRDIDKNNFMKLELPILSKQGEKIGTFMLEKNLRHDPVDHNSLRRIEHLRRTVVDCLNRIMTKGS